MIRNNLVFIVTDKCNARCEICGYFCAPDRKNVIDEHVMLDTIDQAASVQGVERISFSGGEPSLFPELIIKGAEQARKHNLEVILVSNGQWGRWPTTQLTEFFEALKPDRIHFSMDAFHRQYVDDKTFGRAVAFSYAMGVESHVCINQMRLGLSGQDFWNNMGAYKHLIRYYCYNVVPFGRAKQFPPTDFYESRRTERCRCAHGSNLAVVWNGIAFPCCRYEAHYSCLTLGNAKDTPLAELLQSPVMKLVQLLGEIGFSPLLAAAKQRDKTLPVDDFSFPCTVCNHLFRDHAFVRQYAPLIGHPVMREAVREYLVFAEKNPTPGGHHWTQTDARQRGVIKKGHKTIAIM